MKKRAKKDKLPRTPEMVRERMRQSRAAGKHGKKAARSEEEKRAIEIEQDS